MRLPSNTEEVSTVASGGKTVLVLSHTHWDREWYEPFESFRFRLVKAMDRLIEILQKDSRYERFNLDGQLVVLEDYLEIRPEMRQTLQKLVKSGKIGIGPWYVQADEFLSDGESTDSKSVARDAAGQGIR